MNLILDNNILFSLMNLRSMNSFIFNNLYGAEIFAPYFIVEEFNKYEKDCLKKSKLNKKDFNQRKKEIFSKINFIQFSEFKRYVKFAQEFCPDENDIFYFAICLKLNLPLWSNDRKLKEQDKVIVLDTRDLIDLMF